MTIYGRTCPYCKKDVWFKTKSKPKKCPACSHPYPFGNPYLRKGKGSPPKT